LALLGTRQVSLNPSVNAVVEVIGHASKEVRVSPIFEIPAIVSVFWVPEARAIVDRWSSYAISADDFRTATLLKGLPHAKANNGNAYIVDSSTARGAFLPEIQRLIETEVFPAYAMAGIRWFLTVKSDSQLTNLAISRYTSKLGPNGIQLVDIGSVEKGIEWLKQQK
jgi:hypothetical protein